MNLINLLLIPAIPLTVFLILGIFSHKIKPAVSGVVGVAGLATSTLLSYYTAWQYFFVQGKLDGVYQTFVEKITWMRFT
ncbi:MAG TPA: NADH-quinone oxidoreductase subunit L, partial [Salinimicrobium catena]|nr:NADH-quinone oxidoreductase subunit L [Salinimicrobium catena]